MKKKVCAKKKLISNFLSGHSPCRLCGGAAPHNLPLQLLDTDHLFHKSLWISHVLVHVQNVNRFFLV